VDGWFWISGTRSGVPAGEAFIERGAWLTPDIEVVPTEPRRPHAVAGTVKQLPHWLALAGMAVFFTRKSHAAPVFARNTMNRID
jgi:hypothetical protein